MVSKSRLKFIIMAVLLVALLIPVLPAAAAPDYQGGVHVVQRGENLSTIAQIRVDGVSEEASDSRIASNSLRAFAHIRICSE